VRRHLHHGRLDAADDGLRTALEQLVDHRGLLEPAKLWPRVRNALHSRSADSLELRKEAADTATLSAHASHEVLFQKARCRPSRAPLRRRASRASLPHAGRAA
jgi:hypothetical protein